ncbi:MAG: sensor domain-containing protein [Solirubrobacteraceae bacterium]
MEVMVRTLVDPATHKRLAYLLTALVVGPVWFSALVAVWSLCAGLIITPFVIPALIVLAYMTRAFAGLEAALARDLLDADANAASAVPSRPGFWAWLRGQFSPSFWRAQAYLLIRWFVGFPIAVAVITALGVSLGSLTAPLWVPFVHGGAQLGFWRPHTFVQSLVGVPLGLLLLPLSVLIAEALALPFGPVASSLLRPDVDAVPTAVSEGIARRRPAPRPGQALEVHAAADAVLVAVPVVIWALTSQGYFWPIWVALPLATVLAIHAWFVVLADQPAIVAQFRGSRMLAGSSGIGGALAAFLIVIWAITEHGYFWPVWPMLGIAIVLAIEFLAVLLLSPDRAELTERIETLETTRAGAVDAQETELRRIERDLHDGAQARLVALGMSLGMAEQKLGEDPQRAGELLAEARLGAEHALRELRDLARGIHPPVLADRGLGAALDSLASTSPLRVVVSVHVAPRPAPAVESAAYFVAAEALANATKHARARQVDIRIARVADLLELEVRDNGRGGANPNGTGLQGLRRRVEALDGTLSVISPRGGPTTIRAQLPCA